MSPLFEIARHRLRLAHDTLEEADVLLAESHWRGALNRLYYAAFYAARALLATRDLDSARHSGVIALFQQHFVKTDLVPGTIGKTLPRSFETRQTSDYADGADLDEEEVRQLRTDVVAFVATCERASSSSSLPIRPDVTVLMSEDGRLMMTYCGCGRTNRRRRPALQ